MRALTCLSINSRSARSFPQRRLQQHVAPTEPTEPTGNERWLNPLANESKLAHWSGSSLDSASVRTHTPPFAGRNLRKRYCAYP